MHTRYLTQRHKEKAQRIKADTYSAQMKDNMKILLLISVLFPVFSYPAYSMDIKEISEKYAESVVLVKTDKGTGTGFFINAYGTVSTCYHVIQKAAKIEVRWNNTLVSAEVIHVEKKYDQALLSIFRENTPYLPVQKHIVERIPDHLLKASDTVATMGYPFAAEEPAVTLGKITEIYYRYEEMGGVVISGMLENITYKTDMLVQPGNSGSPVFDMNGIVVGMATAKIDSSAMSDRSGKSFVNSIDRLFSRKEHLFQSAHPEKGEMQLYQESEKCLENTNPYYFKYVNCRKDTRDAFCYECANTSCGAVEYKDVFAGSFLGIPLYDSCRPTIISRRFPDGTMHSKKFYCFLQQVAGNDELKKLLGGRGAGCKPRPAEDELLGGRGADGG